MYLETSYVVDWIFHPLVKGTTEDHLTSELWINSPLKYFTFTEELILGLSRFMEKWARLDREMFRWGGLLIDMDVYRGWFEAA